MNTRDFEGQRMQVGVARFIARYTGLDAERIRHIYQMGYPWPFIEHEWEMAQNFALQAFEAGVEVATFMEGIAPRVGLDMEQRKAARDAILAVSGINSVECVASRTGEPLEIILQICEGFAALKSRKRDA